MSRYPSQHTSCTVIASRLQCEALESRIACTAVPWIHVVQDGDVVRQYGGADPFIAAAMNDRGEVIYSTLNNNVTRPSWIFTNQNDQTANVTPLNDVPLGILGIGGPYPHQLAISDSGTYFATTLDALASWTSPSTFSEVILTSPSLQSFEIDASNSGVSNAGGEIYAIGTGRYADGHSESVLLSSSGALVIVPDNATILATSDSGSVLVGLAKGASGLDQVPLMSELRLYDRSLTSYSTIADESRFSEILGGSLSDKGEVVAFVGKLKPGAALTALERARLGPARDHKAIFASLPTQAERQLWRVAGEPADGHPDPYEREVMLNGAALDLGVGDYLEYHGFLRGPLFVQADAPETSRQKFSVVYTVGGESGGFSGSAFRLQATWTENDDAESVLDAGLPEPVLFAGSGTTPGSPVGDPSQTATGVRLWDYNERGDILASVEHTTPSSHSSHLLVRIEMLRRPVVLLPGIFGSWVARAASSDAVEDWAVNRGIDPSVMDELQLRIDPLANVYQNIIHTLEDAGYVLTPDSSTGRHQDLFLVPYDWRLPVAPVDNDSPDGLLSRLTVEELTDRAFRYGVDYLGAALIKIQEQWIANYQQPLDRVDIIAHSMGGLVARSYIQSAGYGGIIPTSRSTVAGGNRLPQVDSLVTIATPYQGAPKAFNPWHNNLMGDEAYRALLSPLARYAYQKVLAGGTITHVTDPTLSISKANIVNAERDPDPLRFLRLYAPSVQDLMPTMPFLRTDVNSTLRDINNNPSWAHARNNLLLDLNSGLGILPNGDTSRFLQDVTATIIYGTSEFGPSSDEPIPSVWQRTGQGLDYGYDVRPFESRVPRPAGNREVYYVYDPESLPGDGTVPTVSASGQFTEDPRVLLRHFYHGDSTATKNTDGPTSHSGLLSNVDVQQDVLQSLGLAVDIAHIRTDGGALDFGDIGQAFVSYVHDPVEGFVRDTRGRRLGWTAASGPLQEIPNSLYIGGIDGMGWVFGPVETPLTLEVHGLGGEHYVDVSIEQGGHFAGGVSEGVLETGEVRIIPIALPGGWHNEVSPFDVDGQDGISVIDALLAINELTDRRFSDRFTGRFHSPAAPPPYLDVNNDNFATPLDALFVINTLSDDLENAAIGAIPLGLDHGHESESQSNPPFACLHASKLLREVNNAPTGTALITSRTGIAHRLPRSTRSIDRYFSRQQRIEIPTWQFTTDDAGHRAHRSRFRE